MTDPTEPTTDRPLVVSLPADRRSFGMGPDTYSIILTGADTAGSFGFIDMHVPPGGGPPPHAHGFEETFYVVEGEIEVFCHDRRVTAGPASAVNIPAWAPHTFRNLAKVPARLLAVVAPAGLEAMFAEIGSPVATRVTPPPEPSAAELAEAHEAMPAVAARYRTRFLSPDTFDHLMP